MAASAAVPAPRSVPTSATTSCCTRRRSSLTTARGRCWSPTSTSRPCRGPRTTRRTAPGTTAYRRSDTVCLFADLPAALVPGPSGDRHSPDGEPPLQVLFDLEVLREDALQVELGDVVALFSIQRNEGVERAP